MFVSEKFSFVFITLQVVNVISIEVTSNPSIIYSGEGRELSLNCDTDEVPEDCFFIRPDGSELCNPDPEMTSSSSCTDVENNNIKYQVGDANCGLTVFSVSSEHLGNWTCKAKHWDTTRQGQVLVTEFIDADIEIDTFWGTVYMEADVNRELTCKVYPAIGSITWFKSKEGEKSQMYPDKMKTTVVEDELISTIEFTPGIEDDGVTMSCASDVSGKDHHIDLSVYMYNSEETILSPSPLVEGQNVFITHKFSAFPSPSPSSVMWHLASESSGMLVVKPGVTQGKFSADNIVHIGSNVYTVTLNINDIQMEDSGLNHTLHLSISEYKDIHLPFHFELLPKTPEPTVNQPPSKGVTEETANINGTINDNLATDVLVQQEGISIFIIIGIVLLMVLICLCFYCVRCCGNKRKQVDQEHAQGNVKVKSDGELEPLLSGNGGKIPHGELIVQLLQAKGILNNVDDEGNSNTFAIMKCGDEKLKASANPSEKSGEPTWNYPANFNISNQDDTTLNIELFHDAENEEENSEESIGNVNIELTILMSMTDGKGSWFSLSGDSQAKILVNADFKKTVEVTKIVTESELATKLNPLKETTKLGINQSGEDNVIDEENKDVGAITRGLTEAEKEDLEKTMESLEFTGQLLLTTTETNQNNEIGQDTVDTDEVEKNTTETNQNSQIGQDTVDTDEGEDKKIEPNTSKVEEINEKPDINEVDKNKEKPQHTVDTDEIEKNITETNQNSQIGKDTVDTDEGEDKKLEPRTTEVEEISEKPDINEVKENKEKPHSSEIKRTPSLPINHPSLQEDQEAITKNAQILRDLTETKPENIIVEDKTVNNSVDEENNNISTLNNLDINGINKHNEETDDENIEGTNYNTAPVVKKKLLSRTSSFEVLRSKTILLDQDVDRTTMNIQHTSASFATVELRIQVSPSPHNPGGISYTRLNDDTLSAQPTSEEIKTMVDNYESDLSSGPSSPGMVLSSVPPPKKKRPLEDDTKTSTINNDSGLMTSTPVSKETSTGITREVRIPQNSEAVTKKPPLPKMSSKSFDSASSPPLTPEANGVKNGHDSDNWGTPFTTLTRSGSITMEAGTQTPKIKARSVVYFDEGSSASEESLSEAVSREELRKEIEELKRQVEFAGKGLTEHIQSLPQ